MMARLLYRILLVLLIPALVIRLLWRARKQPEYLRHLAERFGFYAQRATGPCLWIHTVSVGETRAAAPLIATLRAQHPDHAIWITGMTPTGRAAAQELYGAFARISYLPYDFAGAQRRFLRHVSPRLGILLETELWPNLLFEAQRARVPVVLANARLSERSAKGYLRFGALARPALQCLTAIAAQTRADADRLLAVGAPPPAVCGNLKFEVTPAPEKIALGQSWREFGEGRFIVLAASTREGEEPIVIEAFERLIAAGERHPLLVLVPRHPQRFNEVEQLVKSKGLRIKRRTAGHPDEDTQIWLGDSMGEMAAYYAMADLCIMGGSLRPYGSQNLIEACACGCPVLIGLSDFNFRQAATDAIVSGAARRVSAPLENLGKTLAAEIHTLYQSPPHLAAMRLACGQFADAHKGATERTATLINQVLSQKRASE